MGGGLGGIVFGFEDMLAILMCQLYPVYFVPHVSFHFILSTNVFLYKRTGTINYYDCTDTNPNGPEAGCEAG